MPKLVRCPFHDDLTPSLAIYPDHAYCFGGCGYIRLDDLPDGLNHPARCAERVVKPRWSERELAVIVDVWNWNLLEGPRRNRMVWLEQRGIREQEVRRFRIGHDGRAFVIPVLVGKRVTGVRFRRDDLYADEDEPRYRTPRGQSILLYRPNRGNGVAPLVVCEGEFDCMLLVSIGCDAVTSTGGAQSLVRVLREHGILRLGARVGLHVATDQDDAGESVYHELQKLLPRGSVHRWRWEGGKDISEALVRIPRGEWSRWVRDRMAGCLR